MAISTKKRSIPGTQVLTVYYKNDPEILSADPPENSLKQYHVRVNKVPLDFRDDVCKECKWSRSTFYNKVNGIHPITVAEEMLIERVAKKYRLIKNKNRKFNPLN